jgi:hypothetical protein
MASLFISHSSLDNAQAQYLKDWLSTIGYDDVFLDFDKTDGIDPGETWKGRLGQSMARSQIVLCLVSSAWLASTWCRAEYAAAILQGKKIVPVLVEDGPARVDSQSLLGDLQIVDLSRDQREGVARLERVLDRSRVTPLAFPISPGAAPYPGLLALECEDAGVFFGREQETLEVFRILSAMRESMLAGEDRQHEEPPRLLIVLGCSGAGKSSLMRAGVIPQLTLRPARWIPLVPMIPKEDALLELARSISQTLNRYEQLATPLAIREQLADPASYGAIAERLRLAAQAPEATIVLPIDQAEELLRLDAHRRDEFLGAVSGLLATSGWLSLATIRSDTFEDVQTHRFFEGVPLQTYPLPPMPMARLADVIRGPAARVGLRVDPLLVDAIVEDAKTGDALPLVAFTLQKLFNDAGADGALWLSEYRSLADGEGQGSPLECVVSRTAQATLGKLSRSDTDLLRRAFVPGLVDLTDDLRPVRRRLHWKDAPQGSEAILTRLVDARLLVSRVEDGVRTIEVAHEALLRTWPLLAEAVEEAKPDIRALQDVERRAADWKHITDQKQDLRKQRQASKGREQSGTTGEGGTARPAEERSDAGAAEHAGPASVASGRPTGSPKGTGVRSSRRASRRSGGLFHHGGLLKDARRIARRPEWRKRLGATGLAYLRACSRAQNQRRSAFGSVVAALGLVIAVGIGQINTLAWVRELKGLLPAHHAILAELPPADSLFNYSSTDAEAKAVDLPLSSIGFPLGAWCRDAEGLPRVIVSSTAIRIWDPAKGRVVRLLAHRDANFGEDDRWPSGDACSIYSPEHDAVLARGPSGPEVWSATQATRRLVLRPQIDLTGRSPCMELVQEERRDDLAQGLALLSSELQTTLPAGLKLDSPDLRPSVERHLSLAGWLSCFPPSSATFVGKNGNLLTFPAANAGLGPVHLWSGQSGRLLATLPVEVVRAHQGFASSRAWKTLVYAGANHINLVDVESGEKRKIELGSNVLGVESEPSSSVMMVSTTTAVLMYDKVSGRRLAQFQPSEFLRTGDSWEPTLPQDTHAPVPDNYPVTDTDLFPVSPATSVDFAAPAPDATVDDYTYADAPLSAVPPAFDEFEPSPPTNAFAGERLEADPFASAGEEQRIVHRLGLSQLYDRSGRFIGFVVWDRRVASLVDASGKLLLSRVQCEVDIYPSSCVEDLIAPEKVSGNPHPAIHNKQVLQVERQGVRMQLTQAPANVERVYTSPDSDDWIVAVGRPASASLVRTSDRAMARERPVEVSVWHANAVVPVWTSRQLQRSTADACAGVRRTAYQAVADFSEDLRLRAEDSRLSYEHRRRFMGGITPAAPVIDSFHDFGTADPAAELREWSFMGDTSRRRAIGIGPLQEGVSWILGAASIDQARARLEDVNKLVARRSELALPPGTLEELWSRLPQDVSDRELVQRTFEHLEGLGCTTVNQAYVVPQSATLILSDVSAQVSHVVDLLTARVTATIPGVVNPHLSDTDSKSVVLTWGSHALVLLSKADHRFTMIPAVELRSLQGSRFFEDPSSDSNIGYQAGLFDNRNAAPRVEQLTEPQADNPDVQPIDGLDDKFGVSDPSLSGAAMRIDDSRFVLNANFALEHFDSGSGARVKIADALDGDAWHFSPDGRYLYVARGSRQRIVDLRTAQDVVAPWSVGAPPADGLSEAPMPVFGMPSWDTASGMVVIRYSESKGVDTTTGMVPKSHQLYTVVDLQNGKVSQPFHPSGAVVGRDTEIVVSYGANLSSGGSQAYVVGEGRLEELSGARLREKLCESTPPEVWDRWWTPSEFLGRESTSPSMAMGDRTLSDRQRVDLAILELETRLQGYYPVLSKDRRSAHIVDSNPCSARGSLSLDYWVSLPTRMMIENKWRDALRGL